MRFHHILITTDLSDHSRKALSYVNTKLLNVCDRATVLTVVSDWAAPSLAVDYIPHVQVVQAQRENYLRNITERLEAFVQVLLVNKSVERRIIPTGEPVFKVIRDFAVERECDLIVLGSHGATTLSTFFLGSTSSRDCKKLKDFALIAIMHFYLYVGQFRDTQ